MRPHAAKSLTHGPLGHNGPVVEMVRGAAGAVLGLLAAGAVVLCWRRLAGELDTPLAPGALLGAGGGLATAAWAVRWMWAAGPVSTTPAKRKQFMNAGLSVAVLLAGAAMSLPATSSLALLLFWMILVGGELAGWGAMLRRQRRPAQPLHTAAGPQHRPGRSVDEEKRFVRVDPAQSPLPHRLDAAGESAPDEGIVQHLLRSRAADGAERLRGWLRAEFLPGQRTASVHVAFCPPFAHTPVLSARQVSGPPGQIKTVQLLPYGARLDLKLSGVVTEPTSVAVEFCAEAGPSEQTPEESS